MNSMEVGFRSFGIPFCKAVENIVKGTVQPLYVGSGSGVSSTLSMISRLSSQTMDI